jgi:hypothetical protein
MVSSSDCKKELAKWFELCLMLTQDVVSKMRAIQRVGHYRDVIDAPSPYDPEKSVKLGLTAETFSLYSGHKLATAIAEYYGIVQDGILFARHAFKGLKRPLMLDDDVHADANVVVYSWRPHLDYEWSGTPFEGTPEPKTPPPERVFVVLVREEKPNEYSVFGSVEKWNWIREDSENPHAPIDWQQRYAKLLWSRSL